MTGKTRLLQFSHFSLVLGLLFGQPALAEESVKIGAIFTMTSNVARHGKWGTQGSSLALKVAEYPMELIVEDSAAEGAKAVTAYQKLRAVNHVPIVFTQGSSAALAVKPLASHDKVLQMETTATAPSYGTPGGYQFRTGITATQLAQAEAQFISDRLGLKKIGCLHMENEFGQGMFDVFDKSYAGEILVKETFRPADTDFRAQILKIKAANAPAIWLSGHAREAGLLVAQARQLGVAVPIVSDVYSIESPDFLAGAKEPGNVSYFAPKFDINSQEPNVKSFVSSFRDTYGEEPTVSSAQAYDAVLAMGKVLKACDGSKVECLPVQLRNLDFTGASGRIKFDNEGNVRKELEIKTPVNGEFHLHPHYAVQ